MHSDLHGNVVHHDVELLLLVSMLILLAIPKSPLILKEFLYTSYNKIWCYLLPWLARRPCVPAGENPKTAWNKEGYHSMPNNPCMGTFCGVIFHR